MITVTHCGESYVCTTAIKCENNKFIKLYDENNVEIVSFYNISDFSDYEISGGSFTAPDDCFAPIPVSLYKIGGKVVATNNLNGSDRTELPNAARFSDLSFDVKTQAEYEALATKDENTIYFVTE